MKMMENVRNGRTVLTVAEARLDAANAPELREALHGCIDTGKTQLVLDLSAVSFMDSSALGALISAVKKLGPLGGLSIVGSRGPVARLFSVTRMDRVFALHPSVEAALDHLKS